MKNAAGGGSFRRIVAGIVLVAYVGGCTHMPSGEKAFENFDQCIAANLGLAAAGGVAVGALSAAFTRQLSGSRSAPTAIGTAAGIATAVMIGTTAWRKCAAVYSKSEVVAVATPTTPDSPRRAPGVVLDKLDVLVGGTEDTAPVPEFSFNYVAENPAAKDINARLRHKVEIVRFKATDDDKLILADANDQPLLDGSGNPIPLELAHTIPRERLSWTTIAEEGKDDYVETLVIQQGASTGKHLLKIPPRDQLPLPLPVPMRYTLTVEVGEVKSTRTVDFAILKGQDRPKRYHSSRAPVAQDTAGVAARAPSKNEFVATHTLKRSVQIYSDAEPSRKVVGRMQAKTGVRIEEEAEVVAGKAKAKVKWVKVIAQTGKGGWLPAAELVEVK